MESTWDGKVVHSIEDATYEESAMAFESREPVPELRPSLVESLECAYGYAVCSGLVADMLKRSLHYRKKPTEAEKAKTWEQVIEIAKRGWRVQSSAISPLLSDVRVRHAVLGIASEVRELLTAGTPDDMHEEMGDLFWYMALLASAMRAHSGDARAWTFASIQAANLAKLGRRYAGSNTAGHDLTSRDYQAERTAAQDAVKTV